MAPPRRTPKTNTEQAPPDMFGQTGQAAPPAASAPPPTAPPVAAPPAESAKPQRCIHVHWHMGQCVLPADPAHEVHRAANNDGWTADQEQRPEVVKKPEERPASSAPPARSPAPQAAPAPAKPPAAAPAPAPARTLLPGMRARGAEAKAKPFRMFLVGEPGIGKSTFGAQAESPIFIPAETSPNISEDVCFERPESWEQIFNFLRTLGTSQHEYRTLVLDTADAATALCNAHVLEKAQQGAGTRGKAVYLTDVGGGFNNAGAAALDEEWVKLLAWLDRLKDAKEMNIIILGHSKLGKFRNPEAGGADFDMWVPRVVEAVANRIVGWADIVGLAKKDIVTGREGKKGRAKAMSVAAAHTLYVRAIPTAPWTKNRYELPTSMPLDFETFIGYMRTKRSPAEMEAMRQALVEKAERLAGHTFLDRSGQNREYRGWLAERMQQRTMSVAEMLQLDSKLTAKIAEVFPAAESDEDADDGQAA